MTFHPIDRVRRGCAGPTIIPAALGVLALASASSAQVYVLDALGDCFTIPSPPRLQLDLEPGLYISYPIEPIAGGLAAWNPWGGGVSGCDASGYGCSLGWITDHNVRSDDGGRAGVHVAFGTIAATPELALLRPRITAFRVCEGRPVRLGLGDSLCGDNVGQLTVLVEPAECEADINFDGALDIFDFLQFQNYFDDGHPMADFDCDGQFTFFDFLAFQNAFDAGCP